MMTAATVANASRIELLCLTYEIFLEDMKRAIENEGKDRKLAIDHAREVLVQLVEALDFEVEISSNLFKLYIYMQNLLINKWQDDAALEEVYKLMHTLYEGYAQLSEVDVQKQPVMKNSEEVYAGMTYGRGYLNEVVMGTEQRGFKA